MHGSAFMIAFALSNNYWQFAFQVNSDLTDVSCLSASHTSVVLGEDWDNLLFQGMLGVTFCF